MPAAVVGLALVGGGVVTAATLGYVALGVTVAGMVTKNKTLLKIGGQLGLAAGVAGIAQSFMGAGTAASAAGDVAKVAGGASGAGETANLPDAGQTKPITLDSTTSERGTSAVPYDTAKNYAGAMPDAVVNKAPVGFGDPTANPNQFVSPAFGPGAGQGATQGLSAGANLGATQGLKQGSNLAPTGPSTANDTGGSTKASPDSGFFSFMGSDANKYMALEGGKIVAGGLQGMAETSRANTKLEENRRIGDIQRANAASIGQSNYRVGGGLMQGR